MELTFLHQLEMVNSYIVNSFPRLLSFAVQSFWLQIMRILQYMLISWQSEGSFYYCKQHVL